MVRALRDFRYIAWIFAAVFFIAAVLPVGKLGGTGNFDKVLHFTGFYFLMIFFLQGYRNKSWLTMLLISLTIGFFVEIVQAGIPYRSFSLYDFLADAFGAICGYISYRLIGDVNIELVGTFGFIGKIPVGPGTIASCVFILAIHLLNFTNQSVALFTITATIVGVWVSSYLEEKWGDDPSQVVIDEVVGVGFAILLHRFTIPILLSGFFLFRFFDIVKPWPIKYFEKLPSGIGVMADDIVAGIMANILLTFLSSGLINISGI